jgi:hypothetical protein
MLDRPRRTRRRGAVLPDAAIVYSVVFLLTIGVIIVAMGIFRYQEVAALARVGSRYACVRGSGYAAATGNASPTAAQIKSYILSQAVGLDQSKLTVTVSLQTATGTVSWDGSGQAVTSKDGSGNVKTNIVIVQIQYTWVPELYLSTVTMSSTSKVPMAF